ncbi:TonB-dependent receptor [Novosphingobium malaysiense]|uniref:TonB-dependent receptor n=1 Tax=Novosphingobium malaysiense TaxID=1348853 RepID=UPI001E2994D2|nr:TonB-dependent receptor [Novosphingobium malaysiense]
MSLASLAGCLCLPVPVLAAEVPAPSREDEDGEDPLEVHGNEILVLAPRIRGHIEVPQKPVEILEEEDIEAYGANSIEELIAAISPQTNSGRGRGGGRPVMLINGQRITSWREMRRMPPEAIRRVEILPEEVALRFGYPANQRVVNMILKDQFASITGAGEYNRPTRGGYDNYELETGLFNVSGPRRYNFSVKIVQTTMLTENERNVRQEASSTPDVAGDPDPARYRSLASSDYDLSLEGTMTQGLGENGLGGSITASGGYTHTQQTSLSGLDSVLLTDGADSALRTLPDPLTTRVITDAFEGGLGFSKYLGDWEFSATLDGSHTDTSTQVGRRRDASVLQSAVDAGVLTIDGALPFVPGAGVDTARNRALEVTSLATLVGTPFRMPAGDANLTVKGGYDFTNTRSDDSRNTPGTVDLKRGDVQGGLNLALPLTSKDEDVLGAIGDLTLNLSGGLNHLSDFGTLTDWSAGLTWSPTEKLTLQASYLVDEAAPSLAQLGSPTVFNYNVPIYDFANGTTALVTTISGGNPDLVKEKQRDIKLSATWQLPFLDRANLLVEYFRNRSDNVTESFPLFTPAVETAFPGRVIRDAAGNLIALDRRAVTYDRVASSRMRWGFNVSGNIGGGNRSSQGRSGGGGRNSTPRSAQTGASNRSGYDPSRFEALRKQLCSGDAAPDPATLPERLRERLMGPDGKIDPDRLAQFKMRVCRADGSSGGQAGGESAARSRSSRGPAARFGRGRRGGRWYLSVYHTWRFSETVRIAQGVPVLDELDGDALSTGGVPRHAIEASGGVFANGYGLRMKAEWDAPARVNGTGLPGSSDLRFGSTMLVDLRLFADLGRNENLVAKVPFLKGARVAFTVDNLFDSRQKVTDENGLVPIAYQAAFREPQGRVVGIDIRKMF